MIEGALELGDGAHALFTARRHGNLSSVAGELHEQGAGARMRLCRAIGAWRLVRGYQVHGTVVGRVYSDLAHPTAENGLAHDESQPTQPAFRADGHAVGAPGIAAMVLVADCVPVVLAARGAVAVLHAGWRGLANGVLEEGMRALRDVGGAGPVQAVIGPCAGVCCYEVGPEVHAALGCPQPLQREQALPGGSPTDATPPARGRHTAASNIDLRAIARERLLAAGAVRVQDAGACTICDERYFSHRREAARAGRQAALAWLA